MLPILLEYCSPFVKVDGTLLLYKSKKADQEIQDSEHALDELNCKVGDIYTLSDDENYKRYIIEIHKTNSTPVKYPRKAGKPKKNPLQKNVSRETFLKNMLVFLVRECYNRNIGKNIRN